MVATTDYEALMRVLKTRMSIRKFKPDPVADEDVEAILEAGRWAMSGANSQPWDFIVVKDPETRQKLNRAYKEVDSEYFFWMEQMRLPELRHPAYQIAGDKKQQLETAMNRRWWAEAPVLIVVVGDGRKQWGTVMAGQTFGRGMTHLTDGLANTCQIMHMAAASLGLGSQWVTPIIQEPYKRILNVPDLLTLYLIIPIGYPAVDRRPGYRHELSTMVHRERFDESKYLSNEQAVEYIRQLRVRTIPQYASSARPTGERKQDGQG